MSTTDTPSSPESDPMSEADTIAKTSAPATVETLTRALISLGVQPGSTLLVHSSLSSIGWVCGGAGAVIQALEASLGKDGTLVVPAFSGGMTEPSHWQSPPVPDTWWETIRTSTPPYDPDFTPTRCMGQIAETFRTRPGVTRSDHLNAETITANHALGPSFGEASPLARIYDFDGQVLSLGVGFRNNTSLHLSEIRATWPGKKMGKQGASMTVDGERKLVECEDFEGDSDDFVALGRAYQSESDGALMGKVGLADCMLMSQRSIVDFAAAWMEANRPQSLT